MLRVVALLVVSLYFTKKIFQTKIKVLKQSEHYIWLKLSSCIRNLSNELKDLYICITYIPPVKSPYYSEDIFPSIQNDILFFNKNESCVLLMPEQPIYQIT